MRYIVLSCDSVWLEDVLRPTVDATHLAILKQFWSGERFFRSDGVEFDAVPTNANLPSPSLIRRILAEIYNPRRRVSLVYNEKGPYNLDEVKRLIMDCVSRDDDILTQFIEGDEIRDRLRDAVTFDEVVDVIERMGGKYE